MTVPPKAAAAAQEAFAKVYNDPVTLSTCLAAALEAAAPLIAEAAWRDGYGKGRDDEAENLPLREYEP